MHSSNANQPSISCRTRPLLPWECSLDGPGIAPLWQDRIAVLAQITELEPRDILNPNDYVNKRNWYLVGGRNFGPSRT
jgi:hypothetical protein